jgi:lipocalin
MQFFEAALFAAVLVHTCTAQSCPQVAPVAVDLDKFIAASWFVQKQQIVPYQRENQLYCVVATYDRDPADEGFLFVGNSAKSGGVDGPLQGGTPICAEPLESGVGRLQVAPCFLRATGLFELFAGPYWVVALDEDYRWAIIAGGQPNEKRANGTCTTKSSTAFLDTNGSGLWLFSRVPVGELADEYTDMMLDELDQLGIYKGDLKNVTQDGCDYDGQLLKAEPTLAPSSLIGIGEQGVPSAAPTTGAGVRVLVSGCVAALGFMTTGALLII